MADQDSGQEKTHDPTEKRRKEFFDKGQVPRSREVVGALGLAFGGLALLLSMGWLGRSIQDVFHACFSRLSDMEMNTASLFNLGASVVVSMAIGLALPLGFTWALTLVVEVIQGRGSYNQEAFKLDWSKLNPITGIKQKFLSSQPLVELCKGLAKLFIIGWLVWGALEEQMGLFPALSYQQPGAILKAYEDVAVLILVRAVPVALIIAVLDYGYQWYQLQEQMKMSHQEVKEEHKQSEGDPHVKAQRRQRARQIAMAQTIRDVQKADVIITNPTHYAVALRYDRSEAPAPVVVAMGVDHLAEKIKAEARRLDIPRVENRPLARALYARCKSGTMIPEDLYGAVAKVLAIIWKRRKGRRRLGQLQGQEVAGSGPRAPVPEAPLP